ncbi:LD-carboxypeptidase [Dyella sp.]|jgi:muramoyltetrapeptide carboxypeptidase|uniref:LD-carboxypeptidase n=1 Tax=Dyella sp. TaxID=1869338 RepID=UPI002D788344|nr:LD-carboxypeptidase [Dyella sp.]HET6433280.1 LD-carboxypeptidase [Dyella sp.]
MPRIRLIAPSGYAADPAAMIRGVSRLRVAGYAVENEAVLDRADLRFAGTDAERAGDINALAHAGTLPDIALVTRGGYGAARLLDQLEYDALRERLAGGTLAMVGHSDFTALQLALHARSGLTTFAGPLLADLGAEPNDAATWAQFRGTLSAPSSEVSWACAGDASLQLEGLLWGGNLAVLCSLLGTPYFPRIDGGILFVEDVGEPPYRIERLLYQLHLSGVLGRQRALLLGGFSDCRPGARDNGYTLGAAFAQLRAVAGIPVIDALPHGHGSTQLTLPFGAPARLRVDGPAARLHFSGYPHHG